MKSALIATMLLSLCSISNLAAAAAPNSFTCTGTLDDRDFSLTYGTETKSTVETLTINFNSDQTQSYAVTDKAIAKTSSIFGRTVGLIVESQPGVFESWSMIVPKMSLRSVYNKELYSAVVIRGLEIDSIGSAPNYQQSRAYLKNLKYVNVKCLAALHVN
jgi:hypothetical protein